MIEETNIFSIIRKPPNKTAQEKVILSANDIPLRNIKSGRCIEKQYKVNEQYLLILSTDAFNEIICFYLLDKNFKSLDYAEIYASYLDSPEFHADKVHILDGNKIFFEFLTDKPWFIEVLPDPKMKFLFGKKLYLHRPTKSFLDKVYLQIGHY